MSLLEALHLPKINIPTTSPTQKPPVKKEPSPEAPPLKSTITLVNASPHELTFVKAKLDFPTAKFEPLVPLGIPANRGEIVFRVVEPSAGAKKTSGMAWFSYPGKKGKVDVIFGWSGKKAEVKVIGDGTFTRQAQAIEDLDRGNEYKMLFKRARQTRARCCRRWRIRMPRAESPPRPTPARSGSPMPRTTRLPR